MVYVALLRGINVGGNNKVSMPELKVCFEQQGLANVTTYINSGNVLFETTLTNKHEIANALEKTILSEFGFTVNVLVLSKDDFFTVANALPDSWVNDETMKCDVLFLWSDINNSKILEELILKPNIDEVKYVTGALLWAVDRKNITKSGLMKLVGTTAYKKMTIRNCNTVRKLATLLQDL